MAVGILVGVVAGYIGPVRGYLAQRSELAREEAELAQLEKNRDRLARRLDALNDPVVLEVVAREYGFVRPGERVFRIITPRRDPAPAAPKPEEGDGGGDWLPRG